MMQKFSLFKDFFHKTVYIFQSISVQNNAFIHKLSSARNDLIQQFCNVANCALFYKGASALQFVYSRSSKYCNKNFSKFSPAFFFFFFFGCVVILFSEESLLRGFFIVGNIDCTAPYFSLFTGFVFINSA